MEINRARGRSPSRTGQSPDLSAHELKAEARAWIRGSACRSDHTGRNRTPDSTARPRRPAEVGEGANANGNPWETTTLVRAVSPCPFQQHQQMAAHLGEPYPPMGHRRRPRHGPWRRTWRKGAHVPPYAPRRPHSTPSSRYGHYDLDRCSPPKAHRDAQAAPQGRTTEKRSWTHPE